MRKISTILSGLVVLAGTTALILSVPAFAAPDVAADFNPGSNFVISPYDAPPLDNLNITDEGVGIQVQDVFNNQTVYNASSATSGYKIKPVGNTGVCLEQDGSNVDLQNCVAGRSSQDWYFSGSKSDASIQNVAGGSNGFMGVFNPGVTKPVYAENGHSGFYDHWDML